jgi:hypothetical protein
MKVEKQVFAGHVLKEIFHNDFKSQWKSKWFPEIMIILVGTLYRDTKLSIPLLLLSSHIVQM